MINELYDKHPSKGFQDGLARAYKRDSKAVDRRLQVFADLYRIPHLKMDYPVPLNHLKQELAKVLDREPAFRPWKNDLLPNGSDYGNYLHLDLLPVIDVNDKPYMDLSDTSDKPSAPSSYVTRIGAMMPRTIITCHHVASRPYRCMLIKLNPNDAVPEHVDTGRSPHGSLFNNIVMHIPIHTHPEILNGVRDHRFDSSEYHWQHYEEGEVWFLNTVHLHSTKNPTETTRYNLWTINHFFDHDGTPINDDLVTKFEQAIENYSGPLFPPAWT